MREPGPYFLYKLHFTKYLIFIHIQLTVKCISWHFVKNITLRIDYDKWNASPNTHPIPISPCPGRHGGWGGFFKASFFNTSRPLWRTVTFALSFPRELMWRAGELQKVCNYVIESGKYHCCRCLRFFRSSPRLTKLDPISKCGSSFFFLYRTLLTCILSIMPGGIYIEACQAGYSFQLRFLVFWMFVNFNWRSKLIRCCGNYQHGFCARKVKILKNY